jgi:L-cysteine:1D-myo-inositol 2-amino-2-deoxy-alpha-D-glucopyranoside ligase
VKSWRRPGIPRLSGHGTIPRVWDTSSQRIAQTSPSGTATLYVCGITPYDSTHIGHASTYLAYDTLIRMWLDAGLEVEYVQNSTDVDDPLLERALAQAVDWRELAATQTDRFRRDMEALAIIPPDHYIAVTERMPQIAAAVKHLVEAGFTYELGGDIYFDNTAVEAARHWRLGSESHYDRQLMLTLSAERGGDPDRAGKRDPLDPLLWRSARDGEPSWDSVVGPGRPGWHIECSVISAEFLSLPITVQGGGADLIFPHHEFTAGHTIALTETPLASVYSHTGLVSYQGAKMSKSLGNLVFVNDLIASGTGGRAIRLALLAQRYREDWEWTNQLLVSASERLERWQRWAADAVDGESVTLKDALRDILADDLDTPGALAAVDLVISTGVPPTSEDLDTIDALLGIHL